MNITKWFSSVVLSFGFTCLSTNAATNYVWQDSPSPAPPYGDWASAAHTIQDAVDAASAWDTVLVTNGVYAAGGRAVFGTMTNRAAVDKPLNLISVNGPEVTLIQGYQVPGRTNGNAATRCVYLTNGAVLSGFTLTNGATRASASVSECSGGGVWCAGPSAVVSNCALTGNWADLHGGGAESGTLNNCTLTGNSAGSEGGGVYAGTLNNCTLTGNSARWSQSGGGGVSGGTLDNCVLTDNSAQDGGGAYKAVLNNCTLTGNSARNSGGGASESKMNNCVLSGNSAQNGGGAYNGVLKNCTLTGNSAGNLGGGSSGGSLTNCIVYYNSAHYGSANYDGGTLRYCCATPLPAGTGNLADEPRLASASHLSAGSPCIGRGSAAYASGVDLDGEPWGNPPSIGCDEYWSASATSAISMAVAAAYTNVAVGFGVDFQALIGGRVSTSSWDFGDGGVASNRPWASHAWGAPGDYTVELRAYNESCVAGVVATVTVRVLARPIHYVALNSSNPAPPYSSWDTAATNIQDAVDAAALPGALVLVSNGVYQTGAQTAYGMSNRLAVTKPVTVRSLDGPALTQIMGYQVPGTTNGNGAVRCVYLTNGAVLSGFTLTNGATLSVWDGFTGGGGGAWCESQNALLTNCTLAGNSAYHYGGGVCSGTLNNCTLTGNSAGGQGGGAYGGTLNNCTLTGNLVTWAQSEGGGAYGGTLNNCTLTGNSAASGGGADSGTLNACTLTGNSAFWHGGGAYGGTLNNCTLAGNWASAGGGGADFATLNNCTLTGNRADQIAGGAQACTLNNCVVYYNSAADGPNYDSSSTLNYCCTTPLPPSGVGNTTADPQLASASHLSANSPCRAAGSVTYATGTDIDGEVWRNPPSMGCDEYWLGAATGPLGVAIRATYANVAVGFAVALNGLIDGQTTASVWNFGDGVVVSNQPYTAHAWTGPGDYGVVLTAYSDTYPQGVSATQMVHVVAQVLYVAMDSTSPAAPYSSWTTAARYIQDAVDAATLPGALVLVSNGVYATGGRAVYGMMKNRVVADKPVTVRSVNGPAMTQIVGYQVPGTISGEGAIRCVYLTNGAVLSGFTLTNGATRNAGDAGREQAGGGVWCESTSALVTNCILTGNSAYLGGGGAYGGTLNNCTLAGNLATSGQGAGGGAYGGTLNNCILTGNSSAYGGGASGGTLNNCTLAGNSAYDGGGADSSSLDNCTLTANSASNCGGGAELGTLNNCTLSGNSAASGGGARDAILTNCTLTGNSAAQGGGATYSTLHNCTLATNWGAFGGGAASGRLNNCILTGNWADLHGGGAVGSTLNNCTLTGNSASNWGGGVSGGTLNNCTLVGNSASTNGGGAYYGTLNNCVIYYNTAMNGPNYYSITGLSYCCTTPLPSSGFGNISNEPLFVDLAGGDLHLQTNSPCINSGNNAYATNSTDLDRNPRIVSGTVDIGAYEYQRAGSGISYAWLRQYALPTDGSADLADADGDLMSTWQEWQADTNPTNTASCLSLTVFPRTLPVRVKFLSSKARLYTLLRCTNPAAAPPGPTWTPVPGQIDVVGNGAVQRLTDENPPAPAFYRVSVRLP